jgi:hypothetical protein
MSSESHQPRRAVATNDEFGSRILIPWAERSFEDPSSRPNRCPHQMTPTVEARVLV